MLIRVLTAAAAIGVLGAGPAAAPASSRGRPQAEAQLQATVASALSARLRVSNPSPLQLHGALLDASASSGSIVQYVFHYGDGVVERSYQPLALHGYRNPGRYRATVTVVDASGQQVTSEAVKIHVRDGIPPVVRIDSPRPSQRVRLGSTGVRLRGVATDSGGVRRVELAIQLISPTRGIKTHGKCIWYDARQFLVLSNCSTPFYFTAQYAHGRWSFQIPATATIPVGTYVLRVLAIDRAGNVSHFYAIRLRTILPFTLSR